MFPLILGSFASRDDANGIAIVALTMTDKKEPGFATHTQHEKAIFVLCLGMFCIKELNCKLIIKNKLRLLKRNAMILYICNCFDRIPIELNHSYIVHTP